MKPKPLRLTTDHTTTLKEKLQQLRAPLQSSSASDISFNDELNARRAVRQDALRNQFPTLHQEDN